MDGSVFWRAALIQAASVAALAIALALALSHSFFEDWGWLVGPLAWIACSLLTARVLRLSALPALAGAFLAGVLSAIGVLLGAHWLGAGVAVIAYAAWCGRLAAREGIAWT